MEFGKEFGPTSLPASKNFGSHEVLQRIVISENLKRLIQGKKIGTPPLKCPNNSQEFLIMDGIVDLLSVEFAAVKSNWMLGVGRNLTKNCTKGIFTGIHFDNGGKRGIKVTKNRS